MLPVILLSLVIFKRSLIEIYAKFPWDISGLPGLAFFQTSVQIASELYLYTGGKKKLGSLQLLLFLPCNQANSSAQADMVKAH